jgi:hypothetical protein
MSYTDFATGDLDDLIVYVRSSLSDVPTEYMSDTQILYELVKAKAFVDELSGATSQTVYKGQCIIAVATYYSYVNYTALAERNMGTLPPTAAVRTSALREIAAALLQLISLYPLNSDLTIDMDAINNMRGAAIVAVESVLEYVEE